MILTTFLAVLVLALAFGNIFLSLTSPKRLERMVEMAREKAGIEASGQCQGEETDAAGQAGHSLNKEDASFEPQPARENGFSPETPCPEEILPVPGPSLEDSSFEDQAERERVSCLGKRIERLERLLLKINNSAFIAQKLDGTNLAQRLKDLDLFKQNTRLEIAALRQRLDEIQPPKPREKQNIPDISDEKLHDLVFRVSN